MSRNRSKWTLMLTVLGGLALMWGTAIAKDKGVKAFTGKEYVVALLDPGTITVSDGVTHIRNQVYLMYYDSPDSRITGYMRAVLNYNMDSATSGLVWGTSQSADQNGNAVPDGWVGTFNGRLYSASFYNALLSGVAHGTGANKGMRYEVTDAWDVVSMDTNYGALAGLIVTDDE